MSHRNHLSTFFAGRPIDLLLAKVGLAGSVGALGLLYFASQALLVVIPVSVGIGCLLYVRYGGTGRDLATASGRVVPAGHVAKSRNSSRDRPLRHRSDFLSDHPLALGRVSRWYLTVFVILGLTAYLAVIVLAGERTVFANLIVGAAGSAILLQVLLLEDDLLDIRQLLAQILVVAIVLRLAAGLVTPGFVGVDIWIHVPVFVEGIVDDGSLTAIADSKYVMAPLYHSYLAIATLVFGSSRYALYLTLGLAVPIATLFIYATARLLLPARWALLATALYAFADQVIQWGIHLIPTSVALAFFLVMWYLVTVTILQGRRPWVVPLLLLCSLAVVFTHQLSTAILLLFLVIASASTLAVDVTRGWPRSGQLGGRTRTICGVFFVTLALTLLSWSFTPHTGDRIFLWRMLEVAGEYFDQSGFLNLESEPAESVPFPPESQTLLDTLVPYFNLFGFALLLLTGVIGGLSLLQWNRSRAVKLTYVLTAATFFLIIFGFSLFGFRVIIPGRWLSFLFVPLVILAGIGAYAIHRRLPPALLLAIVLVLAVGYPISMVLAEKGTMDSPTFEEQHPRFSFTESEQRAVTTLETIHPPTVSETIESGHPYKKILEAPVTEYDALTLSVGEDGAVSDHPIVYRDYQSTGPVSWRIPESVPPAYYTRSIPYTAICSPERDVVYANDRVQFCIPSTVAGGGSP